MPGHTNGNQQPSSLFRPGTTSKYVISNTNIPYNGRVVNIGGDLYTTQGGCLEYNSQEVTLVKGNENVPDPIIQTNLIAKANEFRNRRTGEIVEAGTIYHIHPETGPMYGGVHSSIAPGTAGHDYFDYISAPSNGNRQMMENGNGMNRQQTPPAQTGGGMNQQQTPPAQTGGGMGGTGGGGSSY